MNSLSGSTISKAWNLFENYSGIPPDEIEPHVRRVVWCPPLNTYSTPPRSSADAHPPANSTASQREQAFAVFNYPCLGRWRFLYLYITTLPQYPELLERTKAGAVLLDAACCVGQVLRQLAFDRAPQETFKAARFFLRGMRWIWWIRDLQSWTGRWILFMRRRSFTCLAGMSRLGWERGW